MVSGNVRVLGIRDIAEATDFISEWEGDCLMRVRDIMLIEGCYILSSRDKSIYFLIEARSKLTANIHIYVAKGSRGKPMIDFLKDAMAWGVENTSFKYIFNYTKDNRVKLMMKISGSERLGETKGYTVYRQEVK